MIRTEQLTKVYGAHKAVDRISFQVNRGEIVGFLGPNGAGKSTTMRMLTGALPPTSGKAFIGGLDVFENARQIKAMVGYLPEHLPLYTEMTVRSYLKHVARIKGVPDPGRAVEKVIEKVALVDVAHRIIDHLSKGYRQRVGLAQALVHEPGVLILDEPVSGLDIAQRAEIRSLVQELSAGDTTVLLSTHVLQEVEHICHRVLIIDNGQLLASDSLEKLSQGSANIQITVARPDERLVDVLMRIDTVTSVGRPSVDRFDVTAELTAREPIAAAAVPFGLLELKSDRNLEDVYLRLTSGASQSAP